jgi:UDP-glucose 4-epimerase
MRAFVSGGAGFVGSHLVPTLLARGHAVTAYDDLSLGRRESLARCEDAPGFRFVEGDLLDRERLRKSLRGHDTVFHLAANSDIPAGSVRSDLDLRAGTWATWELLEAMRREGARRLVFASTSAVYGEAARKPTPESYGPLHPISLYGASKLACEGLVSAFVHEYGIRAVVFRFANVIGARGTHGAAVDFLAKLARDPRRLEVLGDGSQSKPYLHVEDCVDGMLFGLERAGGGLACFNLTPDGATSVRTLAETVLRACGLPESRARYGREPRGWRGDVPQVRLDPSRMAGLGWKARRSSDEAVRDGVRELVAERWPGARVADGAAGDACGDASAG